MKSKIVRKPMDGFFEAEAESVGDRISRRVFLARVAGAAFVLGRAWEAGQSGTGDPAFANDPYHGGFWLGGDHHIHTKYSSDGTYLIEAQVRKAKEHGLGWCVITDHADEHHAKVMLSEAYPALIEARKLHPEIMVFQGLEWNVPSAEHGTVIMSPGSDEARRIVDFESHFDPVTLTLEGKARAESDAIRAVKSLEAIQPSPLFFANHPSRRGFVSPHELRNWSDAGPHVFRGMEGAPGHQAMRPLGAYRREPIAESWKEYPPESYLTYGGYDWMAAKVGGMWDCLLSEGRSVYITANSDSHLHHSVGGGDFFPGEYTKTIAWLPRRTLPSVLDALRAGSMFTVHGDLIDRLEFYAQAAGREPTGGPIRMGGTLKLPRGVRDVRVVIRIHIPSGRNFGGFRPSPHHVDLIRGPIRGAGRDRDSFATSGVSIVDRFDESSWRMDSSGTIHIAYEFENVSEDFYVRLRGTNTRREEPIPDPPSLNPWVELWFYSNPIFVKMTE